MFTLNILKDREYFPRHGLLILIQSAILNFKNVYVQTQQIILKSTFVYFRLTFNHVSYENIKLLRVIF